jgi:alpha-galactosidase
MTDALARQPIQRWTGQLVPPEYLGAHVAAPFSHQTGRYMPLSMRCATALFGHLGIEWDITQADPGELADLAAWIRLYKEHRTLIHTGRMIWLDTRTTPPGCTASSPPTSQRIGLAIPAQRALTALVVLVEAL